MTEMCSAIKGEPEVTFSFDSDRVVFNILESLEINGWKMEPFQNPFQVDFIYTDYWLV